MNLGVPHRELREVRGIYLKRLQHFVQFLACALVLKIVASVIANLEDYVPPSFDSRFLQGREGYFWDGYHWAFYIHITSGPLTLLVGMLLMSGPFRQGFRDWHRFLGKIQTACVLLLVVPSGIWMAGYAETGPVAGIGFLALGILTGLCALLGWMSAVNGRLKDHARWMGRCYLLLCSAVLLRVIGGAFQLAGIGEDWSYAMAAWMSWLLPLTAFEILRRPVGRARQYKNSRRECAGHPSQNRSQTMSEHVPMYAVPFGEAAEPARQQ